MAFVKEQRLAALSSALYITSTFDDIEDTWASLDVKFPDTIYDITYSDGWRTEEKFEFNTFSFMGRNTEDDVLIEEDDLHWENLSDYYWNRHLNLENESFSAATTNWEDAWQEWDETTINDRLKTLDGNWESKVQTDRTETVINNQFLKYSWAGINSTWDSLT